MTEQTLILLVDDEPDDPAAAADALEGERDRFRVAAETAADGGLDRLADGDVDCVVSGLELADADGLTFLDAVRDADPTVPFLLYTGEGSEAVASAAVAGGVSEYVPKALGGDQYAALAERIENAVEDRGSAGGDELERYRTAVETLPEGVFTLDGEERIEVVNGPAAELLGRDRTELRGEPVDVLVDEGVLDETALDAFRDAAESGTASTGSGALKREPEVPASGDDALPVEAVVAPHGSERERSGATIVVRDATPHEERKRDLERRSDRLETVVDIVSHDLRNSLNLALNRLELVRREADPASEHLSKVERALDRSGRIIEDALRFARESRTDGDTEPVELDAFAARCWREVETNGASLRIGDLPAIEADPTRLRYVFANLYRNAVEHGGEDVTVRVRPLDGQDGFCVEDDGPGIPEAEREDVFEPGHTTTEDGFGFGLTIVAEIVDAHGWTVAASEAPGGGARFEITGTDAVAD